MIKREELNNPNSCMSRAKDDEMTFVLLERDVAAPVAIRAWINERLRLGKNKLHDRQIREAFDCAERMESATPATPAATPMAADLRGRVEVALSVLERDWPPLPKKGPNDAWIHWAFTVDQMVRTGLAALRLALRNDAVAGNESAPQKLPAAAQPQRESEQPEQALREAVDDWAEAHHRLDHSGITDCTRCKRIAELRSGFKLAALSPQTDSQEQG